MPELSTPLSTETADDATNYTFSLTATNQSSLSGNRYFNVFPPYLLTPAMTGQKRMARVSDPTVASNVEPADTTMTWQGGASTLTMFAVTKDENPTMAKPVQVALGNTVAVSWINGSFTIVPAAGGPEGVITVTFTEGIPDNSLIGLVVGPAPILLAVPSPLAPLTLTPDLSLTATIIFGSAYQWPKPDVWDATAPQAITFTSGAAGAASTVSATILVGPDDVIVQQS